MQWFEEPQPTSAARKGELREAAAGPLEGLVVNLAALLLSRELDTPARYPCGQGRRVRAALGWGLRWKLVDHPSTIELGGRGEIPLYGPVAQRSEQRTHNP
jgi:hypothetical protein